MILPGGLHSAWDTSYKCIKSSKYRGIFNRKIRSCRNVHTGIDERLPPVRPCESVFTETLLSHNCVTNAVRGLNARNDPQGSHTRYVLGSHVLSMLDAQDNLTAIVSVSYLLIDINHVAYCLIADCMNSNSRPPSINSSIALLEH
jgi:hypothetical protein